MNKLNLDQMHCIFWASPFGCKNDCVYEKINNNNNNYDNNLEGKKEIKMYKCEIIRYVFDSKSTSNNSNNINHIDTITMEFTTNNHTTKEEAFEMAHAKINEKEKEFYEQSKSMGEIWIYETSLNDQIRRSMVVCSIFCDRKFNNHNYNPRHTIGHYDYLVKRLK